MQRTLISKTTKKIGEAVKVAGWVHVRRDHGKIIFIDLRDRSGLLQCVVTPEKKEAAENVKKLRSEFVVEIEGKIKKRPEKLINPKIETGKVEMDVEKIEILNEAKTPPFEIRKAPAI